MVLHIVFGNDLLICFELVRVGWPDLVDFMVSCGGYVLFMAAAVYFF